MLTDVSRFIRWKYLFVEFTHCSVRYSVGKLYLIAKNYSLYFGLKGTEEIMYLDYEGSAVRFISLQLKVMRRTESDWAGISR